MPFPSLNPHLPSRRPPGRSFAGLFDIAGPVGPEAENARDDVIRTQILLGQTGDLDLDSLGGPTGWPGGELTRGLRRYQRRKGLTVDGLMLPDGETIAALQDDLHDRLAGVRAPTTAEVDDFHDRMARYLRGDGSDDAELPRLELPRADGGRPRVEALPRAEVRSDVDVDTALDFTPGAQVAQLAEAAQLMQAQAAANAAAATGAAGAAGAKQAVPGTTPEQAAAGLQLGKLVNEKVNLLTLPVQIYGHLINEASAPPSIPLDPANEAASKTPPLKPSAPEQPRLEGSKPAEREPTLEELIPPEMKPWIEELTPFDQQLARELMLIYNRRGGPETIKSNAITVKEMMDAFKKYPALADGMEHVGGSHTPNEEHPDKEGKYRQELHFPNIATGQQKGGSWADISFKLKEALAKELGIEYLHLSNAEMLKNDPKTAVSHERRKKANLEANSPDSRVEYVEKPIPKRINGQKIPYDWESYRARVRDFAERLVDELEGLRKASSHAK